MKKNKKMILFLAISALIALGLQAWDDEKLFTTIVGGKGKSNVVFVQDTSGSMREIIYHPDFNPNIPIFQVIPKHYLLALPKRVGICAGTPKPIRPKQSTTTRPTRSGTPSPVRAAPRGPCWSVPKGSISWSVTGSCSTIPAIRKTSPTRLLDGSRPNRLRIPINSLP